MDKMAFFLKDDGTFGIGGGIKSQNIYWDAMGSGGMNWDAKKVLSINTS